jgi:glyoxylase-like metal-dependent hydrolase (beta-lactamase superfamily II)
MSGQSNTIPVRAAGPVQAVGAITTGTADLHVEHVRGSRLPSLLWVFFGRRRIEGVPISVFVIQHDQGIVLFDTGVHPDLRSSPGYWRDPVTRFIMNRVFRFYIGPDDTLPTQLRTVGIATADVTKAVMSHLHFDHVGGIQYIPGAELFTTAEAWAHMQQRHSNREGVLRTEIDTPSARWTKIDFGPAADDTLAPFTESYDLMGDGSIALIPTPGHLPGSLSMFVRADPPILFVGDLCYSADLLMDGQLPGTGDAETLARTWDKVRQLRRRMPELLIVPSHDPVAWEHLAAHPLWQRG